MVLEDWLLLELAEPRLELPSRLEIYSVIFVLWSIYSIFSSKIEGKGKNLFTSIGG